MTSTRLRFRRLFAFGVGMLFVLVWLLLSGMVETRGPACSMGLGRPEVYLPYEGVRYGWPATAVQVGHTSCQGSSDTWTPKPFVAWHAAGVLISVAQLVAGGLLGHVLGGRLFKKH
jgi:hypothetical protein